MFNRSLYDRTRFDRSAEFDTIEATLRGSGSLNLGINLKIYLDASSIFKGTGSLVLPMTLRQQVKSDLSGNGDLSISDFRLPLKLTSAMFGAGSFTPTIGVITEMGTIDLSGEGVLSSDKMTFSQQMISHITGHGNIDITVDLAIFLSNFVLSGSGTTSISDKLKFNLPLTKELSGYGDLVLRRLGALNTETFDLQKINLKPGQTLIIDTDDLNVLIDNILDVDSVTTDSIFFQLQPGENEISFSTGQTTSNLSVQIVWQNRWL